MCSSDLFGMLNTLEESRLAHTAQFQKLDIMFEDAYWSASKSHEIQEQASIQFPSHEEEEISPRIMNTLSMSQVEKPEYEEIWDEFVSNPTLEVDGSHTPTGDEPFREQIDLIPFDFNQVREVDELDKMIGEETL